MFTLKSALVPLFAATIVLSSTAQTPKEKSHFSIESFEQKLKAAGKNAQVLDARTEEEYTQNHLTGALLFSVKTETETQQAIDKLNKEHPVFVYSIGNGRSGQLAKKLKAQNFKEVYELPGGISHWIGSGRPVETTVAAGYSQAEYNKLIASDKLVLVDVSSKYCGACKRLAPIVDSVARENASGIKLVKIEFFDNKKLAQDLHVEAIPHLILYKGNHIVWEKAGVTPKAEIQAAISKNAGVN